MYGPSLRRAGARSVTRVSRARISVPRPAGPTVVRRRLFELLEAGVRDRLTVVTGPPGAGKTLLVSTWLRCEERCHGVAWLSVHRSDTTPTQFWSAVTEAVLASGLPGLESLGGAPMTDPDELLSALVDVLGTLPAPLLLVLDDFHELRAPAVCEQLDGLLRNPPQPLRLVLLSRADPRLSLHRLAVEGHLTELRTADLAFTVEEAAELFALADLSLTEPQLSALHSRTEGWAAGLRLAALSLKDEDDVDATVSTFAGDERSVADYLVEEVLRHQPEPIRQYLLRTSVVDELGPHLANALSGRSDGVRILETLEHAGAFVSGVGDRRDAYRYHTMFRELLRSQLRHQMPDLFSLQHRRAACWYAQHGRGVEATQHALDAGDHELAANLLATGWLGLLVRGQAGVAAELVRGLPRQVLARQPEVAIAAGGALIESGDLEPGREYLRWADDNASAVKPGRRSEFLLARTIARLPEARAVGDFSELLIDARKLLAGYGANALALDGRERRSVALLHVGIGELWTGGLRRARSALEDAIGLAQHGDRAYLVCCGLGSLSLVEAMAGRLQRSDDLAHEAVGLADQHGWNTMPMAAAAHSAQAMCAYHRNLIPEASRQLAQAHACARALPERPLMTLVELLRALIALRVGDHEGACLAARMAREEAGDWQMPARLTVALACIEAEALMTAARVVDALELIGRLDSLGQWGELELVRAQLALAEGDPVSCAERISGALEARAKFAHPVTAIALHALAAVARHQRGEDQAALASVEHALALAEPEGYLSPFVAIGYPLRELIVRRIRAGTSHRALAGDLAEALELRATTPVEQRGALVLEPLSERETAVLRFLPTGLSKAEIASEMFVSVNTVKTHMKNIYRKLDVTDRGQAVRRARMLHLVSSSGVPARRD